MKFKYPEKKVFNFLSLMYIPVFMFMLVVTVDLFLAYQAGAVLELWKPLVAFGFSVYLGFRTWIGLRQAVDFSNS